MVDPSTGWFQIVYISEVQNHTVVGSSQLVDYNLSFFSGISMGYPLVMSK